MKARRVETVEDIKEPGDYCLVKGYTGDKPAVMFILPVEPHDPAIPEWGFGLHHVVSPPHVFRECPDGSLEIRESIGCGPNEAKDGGYYWHGYLDEGNNWRRV